ncbi:aminotransferase class I/II-fold pyridoxal phosphate-dependent enzyme [Streptomyces sp. NBC_01197]|uniref:aminotransferase class I/II-fold pyridoxal phosphate-dependent enzyme n=1 Tax=Streptomyces sp. NBC_01197 TaxID=2903768 RepID=UPI002E0E8BCB|nr:aminotransferase class I/II-fold pyridoxal phosphate-dependent enzyme [Streptomyces sp. NBC_01197]
MGDEAAAAASVNAGTHTGDSPAADQPNPDPLTATVHNSVRQLRADAWSSLGELTHRPPGEHEVARLEELFQLLTPIENCWAFPGKAGLAELRGLHETGDHRRLSQRAEELNRALSTDSYHHAASPPIPADGPAEADDTAGYDPGAPTSKPYFEVLVVGELDDDEERALRDELRRQRRDEDEFVYSLVIAPGFEDAVVTALVNSSVQAVVIRHRFADRSAHDLQVLRRFFEGDAGQYIPCGRQPEQRAQLLGDRLLALRPELDLYLMTEASVERTAGSLSRRFARVFHAREGLLELHLSILHGIGERYRAPFFNALRAHSRRPSGVFHALPISRGTSVVTSHWIPDMARFFGLNILLAETSATSGGLDSLLEPTGPLREAQDLAARAFGARQTYFVTNGTSTANKVVVQALVRPGDVVLVDRNCHKSHHYGLMLAGAHVVYLDAYPLDQYGMYGAVPIEEIKRKLLMLRREGLLDRVKLLLLTNCTFDGIVYNPSRVMEECLALKPDLAFLWDEAWFAFARFHPVYRRRTAMAAARELTDRYRDADYPERYAAHRRELGDEPDEATLLSHRLMPDPDTVRVRVYATQSTHKTLTSLRQGSMIHVFDQEFRHKVAETFREAYMTHTSTSPNYQILASLDLGRRQAVLEGFELVQKQLEQAGVLRDAIDQHPLLSRYLHFLTTPELIPARFRSSGVEQPLRTGLARMSAAWQEDEFVLDPTRATLHIGRTGIDGDTFKHEHLMDRYGVQVNKTTRNTLLFMTTIGTTRSAVAYLIEVLVKIVEELRENIEEMNPRERAVHHRRRAALNDRSAALPDFSEFHAAFRPGVHTPEGDLRTAFFLAYDDTQCEYLPSDEVGEAVTGGREVVSATFVTPYPPGFPVLVPGQVINEAVLRYMEALDTREIHGYRPDTGYRVFTESALKEQTAHPGHLTTGGTGPTAADTGIRGSERA